MIRKPLNQGEFLSALDFVKTDIDNLRAYFEHGAIQPTSAVVEKALKLRVSIEMFVALFGSATARDEGIVAMFDDLSVQNQAILKQNAEILETLRGGNQPYQSTILNEVLNVKETLAKANFAANSSGEIQHLKYHISNSLIDLEQRLLRNIEYSNRQKGGNEVSGEILEEIADLKEDCSKKFTMLEESILGKIETAKDEIIYSEKSDELLQTVKQSKMEMEKSIVFARTNMQVLRGISKQLIGIYQAEKRALADIEKSIAGAGYKASPQTGEDIEISEGFAQLKEELQSISSIINFGELDKIQDTNQAIQLVDNYSNAQFEPEGLLQTAKELEALASELSELEKSQRESEEIAANEAIVENEIIEQVAMEESQAVMTEVETVEGECEILQDQEEDIQMKIEDIEMEMENKEE